VTSAQHNEQVLILIKILLIL